ncbi:hypothetical protein JW968_02385 [Candidatus Woesearchaeota archaeon]|nr:hypothetical protein [Candidatus Woesearchaeota archaeon]
MKSRIYFATKRLKSEFLGLKDDKIKDWINRALDNISDDAFIGVHIGKRKIPKTYIKRYGITNLWKYDLPQGYRLLYSITGSDPAPIAIIISWMNHKEYERIFKY